MMLLRLRLTVIAKVISELGSGHPVDMNVSNGVNAMTPTDALRAVYREHRSKCVE